MLGLGDENTASLSTGEQFSQAYRYRSAASWQETVSTGRVSAPLHPSCYPCEILQRQIEIKVTAVSESCFDDLLPRCSHRASPLATLRCRRIPWVAFSGLQKRAAKYELLFVLCSGDSNG